MYRSLLRCLRIKERGAWPKLFSDHCPSAEILSNGSCPGNLKTPGMRFRGKGLHGHDPACLAWLVFRPIPVLRGLGALQQPALDPLPHTPPQTARGALTHAWLGIA